jgi:hypothetical protein
MVAIPRRMVIQDRHMMAEGVEITSIRGPLLTQPLLIVEEAVVTAPHRITDRGRTVIHREQHRTMLLILPEADVEDILLDMVAGEVVIRPVQAGMCINQVALGTEMEAEDTPPTVEGVHHRQLVRMVMGQEEGIATITVAIMEAEEVLRRLRHLIILLLAVVVMEEGVEDVVVDNFKTRLVIYHSGIRTDVHLSQSFSCMISAVFQAQSSSNTKGF